MCTVSCVSWTSQPQPQLPPWPFSLHPSPSLQVVYEWARGTPFSDITQLTDVMEGSIVRAMVRLDQACRELQVGR